MSASSASATAVVQSGGTKRGYKFSIRRELHACSANQFSLVATTGDAMHVILTGSAPAFPMESVFLRLSVAKLVYILPVRSEFFGLERMSVSQVFTENFQDKPPTASDKLYEQSGVGDPIFHDSNECHIDGHYHKLNRPEYHRLKDVRALTEFCKASEDYCRLFFVESKPSRDRLLVTRELFEQLMEHCKVFKTFREFVVSFGGRVSNDEPHEYRSPHHVHRKIFQTVAIGTKREECGFECGYELRYVTEKDGPTYSAEKVWSVRQMAVYHGVRMSKKQATLGTLCSSLIVISAPENIKDVFHRYHDGVDSKNRSLGQCFEIHLLILHELLGTWRPYLRWLTVELANRTRDAILAGTREQDREINARDQSQKLKGIQDNIEHSMLSIECLLDTTGSLARSYERHARIPGWDALNDEIAQAFQEKNRLLTLIKHDFSTLREKSQSTANLVSRLSEVQAAEDTQTAIEDSKIVKVLSFFTVFYLPTAILGNFFSSSFVDVDEESHRMVTVKNWWVYWVVIASFTIATIFVVGIQGDILDWWDFGWLHRTQDEDGNKKKYRWWVNRSKPKNRVPRGLNTV